jgi:SPFH domain / Band 7 family
LNDRTCVSQDGLLVDFDVTFQYQVPKEYLLNIIHKYGNFDKWAKVVEAAGSSAVHHACSEFTISNFQNKRGIIQSTMEDNLRLKLEGPGSVVIGKAGGGGEDDTDGGSNTTVDTIFDAVGENNGTTVVAELLPIDDRNMDKDDKGVYARAVSLQLRNIELPSAYKDAVTEKQSAEEGIALAMNQRKQNVTKAQTELKTSIEQARKILDTAINDANITLTQAKLKAQETTFAFETEAQVLVRVKSSLNLTTDGVLAYLSNQLYATVPNLHVTAAEPARISRQEEL